MQPKHTVAFYVFYDDTAGGFLANNVASVCFPYPTVLVFIEKLGRDCRGIPRFASHFIPKLSAHGDVDELILDALTLKDSYHFCLLRLYLEKQQCP